MALSSGNCNLIIVFGGFRLRLRLRLCVCMCRQIRANTQMWSTFYLIRRAVVRV